MSGMLRPMDLLKDLQSKVGLDEEKAKKVLEFLKSNAGSVTKYLGGSVSGIGAAIGIGGEDMEILTPEQLMAMDNEEE